MRGRRSPTGPYLIVGLARSGVAAARMLRAHGEVIGVDSGRPDVPDDVEAAARRATGSSCSTAPAAS